MVRVKEAIVVEGRYDQNALRQVVDALVVTTEGFSIFKDAEKQALLRSLAERRGLIVLTDPDGAGTVIRGFINGAVDPKQVRHAYIPDIPGKEKRKSAPSKEGTLGVEGMSPEVITDALKRAGVGLENVSKAEKRSEITKADLYALGLSGGEGSREKREMLKKKLSLPGHLSANELLSVLNIITDLDTLKSLMSSGQ